MDDLDELLDRQSGVLSVRQAVRWFSPSAIRHQLNSRRWQRPHHGVLVTHSGDLTERQRLWVASLAAGDGDPAPLGGLSALRAHGLIGFDPPASMC